MGAGSGSGGFVEGNSEGGFVTAAGAPGGSGCAAGAFTADFFWHPVNIRSANKTAGKIRVINDILSRTNMSEDNFVSAGQ
jgi:hypothetical protein